MFSQRGAQQAEQERQQLFVAKQEIEFTTTMFNKMVKNCFRKCVPKLREEPDLNVAEMTCTDRCVAKYMKAHAKVGVEMQKQQAAMAGQQGAPIPAGQ